mgnify:CR=1 FL=1
MPPRRSIEKSPEKHSAQASPASSVSCDVGIAGEAEQLLVAALIDEPRAGMFFQIVVDVLVDNPAVDTVLLLQRTERQHCIAGQLPGRHLPLHFEHRGKFFSLLLQPIIAFLGERPGGMFHVIGVVDLIRPDVALGGHPLVDAKPGERRQHQRRAVEKQQLAGFFLINRGRVRLVPQPQQEPAL